METKICNTCKIEQNINQFGKYKNRGKEYKRCTCYSCRNKNHAIMYDKNPEIRERMKKAAKKAALKRDYNITEEEFNRMHEEQEGKCKICNKKSEKTLNIDHCHTTNKVRGLLCWNCNIGLGYFKDNKQFLINAIKYLDNG